MFLSFFQRYFSYHNNEKSIGVFNVRNKVFIASTSIKTQLYEDYLYGKSGKLETWLSELEGKSASIFRAMLKNQQLPTYESIAQLEMLYFLLILDLRNPVRFKCLDDFCNLVKNTKSNITGNFLPTDFITTFQNLQTEDGKLKSLISARMLVPDLIDLRFKLLKNTTKIPFIISDNPLVLYNQFLENRKWSFLSQRGYGTIGLQMFLPVNDQYMLALYDPSIYKIGNKKEKIVEIGEENSVDQFNILQFLNSTDTINFNHKASEHYIRTLYGKSLRYKKGNEAFLKIHPVTNSNGNVESLHEGIELGVSDLNINLSVPKIKFLSKSVAIKLNNSLVQLRKGIKISDVTTSVVSDTIKKRSF